MNNQDKVSASGQVISLQDTNVEFRYDTFDKQFLCPSYCSGMDFCLQCAELPEASLEQDRLLGELRL